jgi:hypothetical protein
LKLFVIVLILYQGRMQDELICVKLDHEEELEQVRQDIMTAVCAIKANEDEEPDHVKHKILQYKHAVMVSV